MTNPSISQKLPLMALEPHVESSAKFRAACRSLAKNSLISETCWQYHIALCMFTALMLAIMLVLWPK